MSNAYEKWLEENPMSLEAQRTRGGSREIDPTRNLQEAYAKMSPSVKAQLDGMRASTETTPDGASTTRMRAPVISTDQQRIAAQIAEAQQRQAGAIRANDHIAAEKARKQIATLEDAMQVQRFADEAINVRADEREDEFLRQGAEDLKAIEDNLAEFTKQGRLNRILKQVG